MGLTEELSVPDGDRLFGMFLGLAIGDAVGTTLEFRSRDSYVHLTDMIGGGPFSLNLGEWTDDTSMALCIAESLKATGQANGTFDTADLMRRFLNWWRFGYCSVTGECFDIGMATRNALYKFEITGDPIAGSTNEYSAGNGSIMRLAPIVLRYSNDPQAALNAARLQSITTHGAAECVEACLLMTHVLQALSKGVQLRSALASAPPSQSVKIARISEGSFFEKSRDQIRSTGYVVDTLEAALWAVHQSSTFEEAVLIAANLGDDADTVAAVAGQIAGARWGSVGIPERWLATLAWRDEITKLASELIELSRDDINFRMKT
jgi:ADP-ribosyl-[dinitrogen reductase] hydrolase